MTEMLIHRDTVAVHPGLIAQLSAAGAESSCITSTTTSPWPAERRALLEQLDAIDDE